MRVNKPINAYQLVQLCSKKPEGEPGRIIIKTQNNKTLHKDQLKHATNNCWQKNQTRDTVSKTLLKTDDKKCQIHSDLKGMEIN